VRRYTVSMPRKAQKKELHNPVWEKKVTGIQFEMFHVPCINKFLEVSHTEAIVLPVKVREEELAGSQRALSVKHKFEK
jgi:hypothetical protein